MTLYRNKSGKQIPLSKLQEKKLRAEWAKDTVEEANVGYKSLRQAEYPTIDELVVALWEGDQIAIAALQEKRIAIKLKHPKTKAPE